MCEPTSIVMGVMAMVGSMQASKVASDAADQAYDENVRASSVAKADVDRQINLQESQAQEAAAQQQIANDLATQTLVARGEVAAGEGTRGASSTAVIADIARQGLEANTMISRNLDREVAQMSESRRGATSQYTSRINAVSPGGGANILGAVLAGAQTGLSVAGSVKSLKGNEAGGVPTSTGPNPNWRPRGGGAAGYGPRP
jgi:hypothetical protein